MMFTAAQAKQANYTCAAISLIILLTRAAVSRRGQKAIDLAFWLVALSIVVVITRIVVVFYYLLYGTASDVIRDADYFNSHDLSRVVAGSKLSLAARVLITASCWLQICLLLLFYSQLYTMKGIRWVAHTIRLTWFGAGLTFLAVVLATFLECRPLHLYWQVQPSPGSCIKGYVQLLVQCISNIVLDLMLLVISYPILFCKGRSLGQHFRVAALFILGTFCIIVTTLRLVSVFDSGSAQPTRSLWASIQMVVSTFVANAPTIYGELKVQKRKKSNAIARRMSRPELWGPDSNGSVRGLLAPQRAVTVESQRSGTSGSVSSGTGRKDWFDHLEDIEAMGWKTPNWGKSRYEPG